MIGRFVRRMGCLWICGAAVVLPGASEGSQAVVRQDDEAVHQVYSDDDVAGFVDHVLRGLGLRGLEVRVVSGIVTLRGAAPSLGTKREAVKRARRAHDVREVVDEMTVYISTPDAELARAISEKLERFVHYTIYDDVEALVRNGHVTLTGVVTGSYQVTEIESTVASIDGVHEIDNQLRVLPDSATDEQMRIAIAVSLYRLFPDYATDPGRRIHVIVETGHVTLIGTVHDRVEKHMAETEAREVAGVISVENRLATEVN